MNSYTLQWNQFQRMVWKWESGLWIWECSQQSCRLQTYCVDGCRPLNLLCTLLLTLSNWKQRWCVLEVKVSWRWKCPGNPIVNSS